MRKVVKIILIISVILIGVNVPIYYFIDANYSFIDKESVIKTYINNKNIFNELSNYALQDPKNISVYELEDPKNILIESDGVNNPQIDIKKIRDDCTYLSKKIKYKYIVEDDKTVEFIRQSTIGYGQGILYLKNENKASDLIFMKKLEHIEGNWYYFEAGE